MGPHGFRMNPYRLTLYVVGDNPASARARTNLDRICQQYLESNCNIQVIDLQENPQLAEDLRILATPMLVREDAAFGRRVIGDLSDQRRVLSALELPSRRWRSLRNDQA